MNTRTRYRFHRQAGVGLVEIMVAVTLSLILTAGLVQVYTGNKQTYRIQESLSRLQENGRFALDFITRDLRSAGFLGCAGTSTKTTNTLNNASSFNWDFDQIIEGFEAASSSGWDRDPVATAGIVSPYLPARDVLTIRRSLGNPVQVGAQGAMNPAGSAPITVARPHGLQPADVVMVTDCTDAAIFNITGITPNGANDDIVHAAGGGSPGNASPALGKDYTTAGAIVELMTSTYYVGTGVSGRPALFRQDGAAAAQELVEGVEDMQILYGIDTDGDRTPNRYVTADQVDIVADWGDAVSTEVRLLLQTLDNNLASQANQQYTFNGQTFVSPDRRLRRTFTNTISIRNRTL